MHFSKALLLPVLALLLTSAAAPQPRAVQTFGDWATGCDNLHRCMAVSLVPLGAQPELFVPMTIRWAPSARAVPEIAFERDDDRPVLLSIDDQRLGLVADNTTGAGSQRLALAMARGHKLELLTHSGAPLQRVSLNGLTAALLYIEAQQGRAGTNAAVLRRGTAGYQPKPAPAQPVISPVTSMRPPAEIASAAFAREDDCPAAVRQSSPPTIARLDAASTLVLTLSACGSGAYNFAYGVRIASNAGQLRPARFDFPGGMSGEPDGNDLTNAEWDPGTRRLISRQLAQGSGTCGRINYYAWDGSRFRLVDQGAMPECRGAGRFIPVWHRPVVRR